MAKNIKKKKKFFKEKDNLLKGDTKKNLSKKKEKFSLIFFLKQNKKWFIYGLIAIVLILVILYMFNIKLRFVLKEQMILTMTPMEKSYEVIRDNNPKINFTVSINNPRLCKSYCEFKLIDVSQGKTIYEDSSFNQNDLFFSYELNLPDRGEGQKIFNYKVACNNVRSGLCSTNEKKYFKTALITVNYKLNDTESEIKDYLYENLKIYFNNIEQSDLILKKIEKKMYKTNNLTNEYSQILNEYFEFVIRLNNSNYKNYKTLWKEQDYINLNEIFNLEFSQKLIKEINQTNENLKNILIEYNENLNRLNSILNNTEMNNIYNFYNQFNYTNVNQILTLRNNFNQIVDSINKQNFDSYTDLKYNINSLHEDYLKIISNYINDYEIKLNETKNMLIKINSLMDINFNMSDDICMDINLTKNNVIDYNLQKERNFNNTYPFINKTDLIEEALFEYFLFKINLSDNFNYSKYENLPLLYKINFTYENQTTFNLTEINLDLITPIYFDELIKDNEKILCSNILNLNLFILTAEQIDLNFSINRTLFIHFEDNKEQCCFKGICDNCCEDDCDDLYPIVFLHGHAITKQNRPEMSHEAFAKIQELLEKEGYVNAGHLGEGLVGEIPDGDWGKVRAPFSIRLSYYLIKSYEIGSYSLVAQKTDNLENYALRLNDLIKVVKQRTGKDKVNIVAHSMGGLVVRDYIYIFGGDSINKAILVGTPNHGIEGKVRRLCSLTGASRECNDMAAGSNFMRKINRPSNIPDVELYTIRAVGCDMNGRDGDGIVLADNVPLSYATNFEVKGECTDFLNSNLHTRFLDPDIYPETYEIIKKIMVEN